MAPAPATTCNTWHHNKRCAAFLSHKARPLESILHAVYLNSPLMISKTRSMFNLFKDVKWRRKPQTQVGHCDCECHLGIQSSLDANRAACAVADRRSMHENAIPCGARCSESGCSPLGHCVSRCGCFQQDQEWSFPEDCAEKLLHGGGQR